MINKKKEIPRFLVGGESSIRGPSNLVLRKNMQAFMQSASTAKTAEILAHIDEQMKQQQKEEQEAKRAIFKQELKKLGIENAFDGSLKEDKQLDIIT